MKTLLLTSAGMKIKEEILDISPKPANQIKLAHIITASKAQKDTSYVEEDRLAMEELGFQVMDIDLEGKTEIWLRELLRPFDIIYVQGGNTFYLLKYIKESGFDRVVKDLIQKGVLYIGVSAGSIVAGPDIKLAGWKNIDKNIVDLKDFFGLHLVSFCIFPHYRPEYKTLLEEEIPSYSYPVRILTDEQAFLVRDQSVTLVGREREIRL